MVSAGGAVTSYTRIRDLAVHEEYRQHGAQLLLNDIGKVAGNGLADVTWCSLVHPCLNPEEQDRTSMLGAPRSSKTLVTS
jgi:hypothetical protein